MTIALMKVVMKLEYDVNIYIYEFLLSSLSIYGC